MPNYVFEPALGDFSGQSLRGSLFVPEVNKTYSLIGKGKANVRMNLAQAALDDLEKLDLLNDPNDIVKNPSKENAISQLNQLYQHGFISEPEYVDEETTDAEDKIIWKCEIHIKELPKYWKGTFSSKKEGQRNLAYLTLLEVLGISSNK